MNIFNILIVMFVVVIVLAMDGKIGWDKAWPLVALIFGAGFFRVWISLRNEAAERIAKLGLRTDPRAMMARREEFLLQLIFAILTLGSCAIAFWPAFTWFRQI